MLSIKRLDFGNVGFSRLKWPSVAFVIKNLWLTFWLHNDCLEMDNEHCLLAERVGQTASINYKQLNFRFMVP
jgi:hypothetical protein